MTGYIVQCIGEDVRNVSVIPKPDGDVLEAILPIVENDLDSWPAGDDVKIGRLDGECVFINVDGEEDLDYYTFEEIELIGFE